MKFFLNPQPMLAWLRENTGAANATRIAAVTSQTPATDPVCVLGPHARDPQCGRSGSVGSALGPMRPGLGTVLAQTVRPPGLRVQCRWSRRCSCLARGNGNDRQ